MYTISRPTDLIPQQRRTTSSGDVSGPASLTQAGDRPSGSCPECGSARMTALAMTLTDGTPVDFASCHDCEHRQWTHEGDVLPFTAVIDRATKSKV